METGELLGIWGLHSVRKRSKASAKQQKRGSTHLDGDELEVEEKLGLGGADGRQKHASNEFIPTWDDSYRRLVEQVRTFRVSSYKYTCIQKDIWGHYILGVRISNVSVIPFAHHTASKRAVPELPPLGGGRLSAPLPQVQSPLGRAADRYAAG